MPTTHSHPPTPSPSNAPSGTLTLSCADCEVTWATAEGPQCWSCGRSANKAVTLADPTRPPRDVTPVGTPDGRVVEREDILRAHAMGLPDPRAHSTRSQRLSA